MWIFEELGLQEEELINVFLAISVPTATYVKIRPHKTKFIELPDPKSFLEIKFRNYVSLTKGNTIHIQSDDPTCPIFKIDIMDVKPPTPFKTVSVVNCDVKLDFEAPLDYVEPEPVMREPELKKNESKGLVIEEEGRKVFKAFKGSYRRLDGKEVKIDPVAKDDEYDPRKHRLENGVRENMVLKKFQGTGTRIG